MGTGFSTTSRRKKKSSVTQKSPTQESTPTPIKIRSDQALVKEKFGDTVEGIGSPEIERIRRGEAGRVFEEQVRGADPGQRLAGAENFQANFTPEQQQRRENLLSGAEGFEQEAFFNPPPRVDLSQSGFEPRPEEEQGQEQGAFRQALRNVTRGAEELTGQAAAQRILSGEASQDDFFAVLPLPGGITGIKGAIAATGLARSAKVAARSAKVAGAKGAIATTGLARPAKKAAQAIKPGQSLIKNFIDVDTPAFRKEFGLTNEQTRALTKQLGNRRVNEVADFLTKGANPQKTIGKRIGDTLKANKGTIGLAVGVSGTMTWLASDNIIGGVTIFSNTIRDAVTFGQMSPEEGLASLDSAQEFINDAKTFINVNTALNPVLWPSRNLALTNTEVAQLQIDTNKLLMNQNGGQTNGK